MGRGLSEDQERILVAIYEQACMFSRDATQCGIDSAIHHQRVAWPRVHGGTAALRVAKSRSLSRLEGRGLVVRVFWKRLTFRMHAKGEATTHVVLTPAGARLAHDLQRSMVR